MGVDYMEVFEIYESIEKVLSIIISVALLYFGIWILYSSLKKFPKIKYKLIQEEWLEYKGLRDICNDKDITEGTCVDFAEHVFHTLMGTMKGIAIMDIVAVGMIILGGGVISSFINSFL